MRFTVKLILAAIGVLILTGGICAIVFRDIAALWYSLKLATAWALILLVPAALNFLRPLAVRIFGPDLNKIRFKVSRFFVWVSAALFCFGYIMLAALWRKAALDGMIPEKWDSKHYGNHGPWFDYPVGYRWTDRVYLLFLLASGAALMSVVFKLNRTGALLLGTSVFSLIVIFVTHFWLMD